jgi:hypothetical protein
MKAEEFFELTKNTRAAQKLYFQSRLQGDLFTAKSLARELDKAIAAGLDEPTTIVSAEEERQLRLHLEDERDAGENETYLGDDDE